MTIWDVLETSPTSDLKTIKRAYARKLKTIDRASDIDGFQTLRQAYDAASFYAVLEQEENIDEAENVAALAAEAPSVSVTPVADAHSGSPEANASPEPDFDRIWADISAYLGAVENLLADEQRKHDPAAWQPLWDHDLFTQLITKEILYDELFGYFIGVTPTIEAITGGDKSMPEFVLPRFNEIFSWSADEINLARRYDDNDIDRLLLLASHSRIQSRMQSAENDISSFGRIYIWATGLIILAMLIKSWFF